MPFHKKAWSAALAFGPVRRHPGNKSKLNAPRLPAGASVLSSVSIPATAGAVISNTGATISSTAVIFAPPSLVDTSATATAGSDGQQEQQRQESAGSAPQTQGWGKKIKPPSMVLDDDVNGFKKTQHKKNTNKKGKNKKVGFCVAMPSVS